jgi:hypothetical protein
MHKVLIAATVLACAGAAHAEVWKDLDGKWCPEIEAKRWFNTGGESPTNKSLEGKVWLLELFGSG